MQSHLFVIKRLWFPNGHQDLARSSIAESHFARRRLLGGEASAIFSGGKDTSRFHDNQKLLHTSSIDSKYKRIRTSYLKTKSIK